MSRDFPSIKLSSEYRITPYYMYALGHNCTEEHTVGVDDDYKSMRCMGCKKLTPEKIMFVYNLWKFHNNR